MQEKKLQALLNLLDDKDEVVYNAVYQELVNAGESVLPFLHEELSKKKSELLSERIKEIIDDINFDFVEKELIKWKKNPENTLLYGAFLIAKLQYPELEFSEIEKEINQIADKVNLELNIYMTALQQIKVLNFRFFRNHRFKGNFLNPESKTGAFINEALKKRKANHIISAIIYISIAEQLEIDLKPVNFPHNALLALVGDEKAKDNIVFYINSFNNGLIISKSDIEIFLKKNDIKPKDEHFYICNNTVILKEYVKFLLKIFKRDKYFNKENYKILLNILSKK